ncbi:MAG: hypothetical protein R3F25_08185 [Gammaproteobacteria bacterium]
MKNKAIIVTIFILLLSVSAVSNCFEFDILEGVQVTIDEESGMKIHWKSYTGETMYYSRKLTRYGDGENMQEFSDPVYEKIEDSTVLIKWNDTIAEKWRVSGTYIDQEIIVEKRDRINSDKFVIEALFTTNLGGISVGMSNSITYEDFYESDYNYYENPPPEDENPTYIYDNLDASFALDDSCNFIAIEEQSTRSKRGYVFTNYRNYSFNPEKVQFPVIIRKRIGASQKNIPRKYPVDNVVVEKDTALVKYRNDLVEIYQKHGSSWRLSKNLEDFSNGYGNHSIAVSDNWIAIGGDEDGNVKIDLYRKKGSDWKLQQTLNSNFDNYASSLVFDGNYLYVGGDSYYDSISKSYGAVDIYKNINDSWGKITTIYPPEGSQDENFGSHLAVDGNTLVISGEYNMNNNQFYNTGELSEDIGRVYIYNRKKGEWKLEKVIDAGKINDLSTSVDISFGRSLAIESNTLVIGAPVSFRYNLENHNNDNKGDKNYRYSGSVYIFNKKFGKWRLKEEIKSRHPKSLDHFGEKLQIAEGKIFVGAFGESNCISRSSGAVFVYKKQKDKWKLSNYLKDQEPQPFGMFGRTLATDGKTLIVNSSDGVDFYSLDGSDFKRENVKN